MRLHIAARAQAKTDRLHAAAVASAPSHSSPLAPLCTLIVARNLVTRTRLLPWVLQISALYAGHEPPAVVSGRPSIAKALASVTPEEIEPTVAAPETGVESKRGCLV